MSSLIGRRVNLLLNGHVVAGGILDSIDKEEPLCVIDGETYLLSTEGGVLDIKLEAAIKSPEAIAVEELLATKDRNKIERIVNELVSYGYYQGWCDKENEIEGND